MRRLKAEKFTNSDVGVLNTPKSVSMRHYDLESVNRQSLGASANQGDKIFRVSRESLIRNHDAKSQFEQTTVLEIFENRVGASNTAFIGVIFLAIVIASGAAFVPLGVNLNINNPLLKVSWRVTNMVPFLALVGIP